MHDVASETSSVPAVATPGGGGTLYLVVTQVVSRAFTFLGNQFLLHYLSPSLLGLSVQLEVLSVTVLYFARESLRVALQRQPSGVNKQIGHGPLSQDAINVAYLAISVGLLAATGFGYGYLRSASDEVLCSVDFGLAFALYATSTFIELFAEPCFVIIQQHSLYRSRARAETAAALARCAAACIAAVTMRARQFPASVLPFAVGQLSYSAILFVAYLTAALSVKQAEGLSMLPRKPHTRTHDKRSNYLLGIFSKPLLFLTATFYAQSVFKLLLTQGDSLILSFLTDLKSQGAFALASNYGGLLSRLIFQPVEESSRNIFGRLLAPASKISENGVAAAKITGSFTQALSHLTTALRIYTLLALPLLSILPPILASLSTLILRPQWRTSETTSLLNAYLHYIPFLALNGILDAFVTSVATPTQLRTQNLLMAAVTAVYGVVAWILMGTGEGAGSVRTSLSLLWGGEMQALGSTGLVYANMVNMALRIAFSVWFVSTWVRAKTGNDLGFVWRLWRKSLPSTSAIVIAVAVGGGLRSVLHRHANHGELAVKRFFGIQGLSSEDAVYVLGAAVVLGSSMLISEHQFLLDLALPLLPKRLAARITPYLPKQSTKEE